MTQFVDLVTDKKFLTGPSALALALGMGATPAYATLQITPFTSAQQTALDSSQTVLFGPSWDMNGFSAFNSSLGYADYFNLSGASGNGVAVDLTTSCPPAMPGECKLHTFNPGDQVDGSAHFQSAGDFNTWNIEFKSAPDGNYYFGLDDIHAAPDPFGWAEITLSDGDVILDRFAFEDSGGPALIPGVSAIPEPATLSLFAVGAAAVVAARRRKKRQLA